MITDTMKTLQNSPLDATEPGGVHQQCENLEYIVHGTLYTFRCYVIVGTLSNTKSHSPTPYQHYVEKIPEDKQAKLQYEIVSDQHIRRLAEKLTGWEEKYDLFRLDRHDVHVIKHGASKNRPVLQQ